MCFAILERAFGVTKSWEWKSEGGCKCCGGSKDAGKVRYKERLRTCKC